MFCALTLSVVLWASAASAQQFMQADQAEQWITMTQKNYTARDLHLTGPVKRVVQIDSIRARQPIPLDSATINETSINLARDTSVWEFDREGNVISALEHGIVQTFHRDAKGRIDSVAFGSMDEMDSYLLKYYDAHDRLMRMRINSRIEGHVQDEMRIAIVRKANGDVDSVITNETDMQTLHAMRTPKRKDGLHATKLGTHDKDGEYSIEYLTDANDRLRDIQITVAMKIEDKLHMQNGATFDSTGNLLRKEMNMLGNQFVQTYEYGPHGEMTSYHNSAHALGEASTVISTMRYNYTYDAHGNWTLRTIEGQLPDDTERAAGSSESIPHIERHIEYW